MPTSSLSGLRVLVTSVQIYRNVGDELQRIPLVSSLSERVRPDAWVGLQRAHAVTPRSLQGLEKQVR
jgi:hypothetical protein